MTVGVGRSSMIRIIVEGVGVEGIFELSLSKEDEWGSGKVGE